MLWEMFYKSFFLLLIPGLANIIPVVFRKVRLLDYPIDFGFKYKDKDILGKGKTWRGLVFGTIGSGVGFASLFWVAFPEFVRQIPGFSSLDFKEYILITFFLAFGALLGDILESLIKRRVGVSSGNSWFPFDQIDWIIGSLAFYSVFVGFDYIIFYALAFGLLAHIIIKFLGYLLKIDNKPF